VTREAADIGLGSNCGDRIMAIRTALENMMVLKETRLTEVSSVYETSPVGLAGRPFLNAAAKIETGLDPREILMAILGVEAAMGRIRHHGGWEPRIIDLDLLLYGNTTLEEDDLTLPHPRMLSRRFVMEPLAELAPGLKIPPTGITASGAADQLRKNHPEQAIKRLGTLQEVK
jgi:2-amino-4-hydroxy-6-hydroxymethyldihydropteridine diphosphokinase